MTAIWVVKNNEHNIGLYRKTPMFCRNLSQFDLGRKKWAEQDKRQSLQKFGQIFITLTPGNIFSALLCAPHVLHQLGHQPDPVQHHVVKVPERLQTGLPLRPGPTESYKFWFTYICYKYLQLTPCNVYVTFYRYLRRFEMSQSEMSQF
jgi:hypothetical protein